MASLDLRRGGLCIHEIEELEMRPKSCSTSFSNVSGPLQHLDDEIPAMKWLAVACWFAQEHLTPNDGSRSPVLNTRRDEGLRSGSIGGHDQVGSRLLG